MMERSRGCENVSVIIPTFNGEKFLADAVHSVFCQRRLPLEIIVVDDCSRDNTLLLVEKLKTESPVPLRIIKLDVNSGGPAKPINVGISNSCGDLIAVLDQDDTYTDCKLERQTDLFRRDQEVVCIGGLSGSRSVDRPRSTGQSLPPDILASSIRTDDHLILTSPTESILSNGMFLVGFPALMFRKKALEEIGGVNENLRIVGDFDLLCRISEVGKIVIHDDIVYMRGGNENSLSQSNVMEMLREEYCVRRQFLSRPRYRSNRSLRKNIANLYLGYSYWLKVGGKYKNSIEVAIWALCLGASLASVTKNLVSVLAYAARLRQVEHKTWLTGWGKSCK
jgi:glycosyltransferase involved in cell wall biosynthesis